MKRCKQPCFSVIQAYSITSLSSCRQVSFRDYEEVALFSPLSVIYCQVTKLGGSNFWRDEYLVLLVEWKGTVPFCREHWQLLIRCFSDVVTRTWLCQSRFMQGHHVNLDLYTRFNPDESAPPLLYRHMRQSISTYTIPSFCADSHVMFMHIQARMLSRAL